LSNKLLEIEQPTVNYTLKAYPKQLEFIKSPAYISLFCAGIGSGKTHAGAIKTLLYCMANPGAWGMVTAPYMKMLENSTIPTYLKVFPNEFIYKIRMKPHPELETTNGCKLFFWSTDKPETIAGVELAFAHMDETSLSPEAAYVNIKKRLRQRDEAGKSYPYQIWMSTTPRQLNWLYKEITRPDSVIKVFTGSTMDNKYLENREDYIKNTGLIPGSKQYEQEIEGKFVLLTGDCLFNQDTLDNILLDCMEPLETRDEGTTRIWKKPVVGGRYVAGADCADEGGGGVNDLIIIDWSTGEEMAEINADIAADRFAMMAFSLLREYGNPLVAVERNANAGGVVTTKLQDMGYSNLYKDRKGRIGWYTMANGIGENVNRFTMLLEYEEAVRLRQTVVRSTDAVGEMSTLVRDEGGRYKPRSGCRSDRVMARAICWQMKKEKPRTGKGGFKTFRRIAVI
jgi:hypothetical protein